MVRFFAFVCVLLVTSHVFAGGRTLTGLIELPTLQPHVRIYSSPSYASTLVTVINRIEDLEHREFSFEREGATVYAQSGKWFYIGLSGSGAGGNGAGGWLAPEDAGAFHPLDQLIKGEAYLTTEWDGRYWRDPEHRPQDANFFAHRGTERVNFIKADVNILGHQLIKDKLWFKVEILGPGRCGARKPTVFETGWVPVENSDHKQNLWFSSRGC